MVGQKQLSPQKGNIPFGNDNIDVLGLPLRIKHALQRQGISTVYDLILRISDLQDFQQIGPDSTLEINDKLFSWMRDNIKKHPDRKEPIVSDIGGIQYPFNEKELTLEELPSIAETVAKSLFSNSNILDLNLSVRSRNALMRRGINTPYDLVTHLSMLEDMRNVGTKLQQEIKEKLVAWARENLQKDSQPVEENTDDELEALESSDGNKVLQLTELFQVLKDRRREILFQFYGIENDRPKTLQETADLFGITREAVRQIKERALAKLQKTISGSDNLAFIDAAVEWISQRGGVVSGERLADGLKGNPFLCGYQASGILGMLKDLELSSLKVRLIYLPFITAWSTSTSPLHLIELASNEMLRIMEDSIGFIQWQDLYSQLIHHEDLFALDEALGLSIAICFQDHGALDCTEDGRWVLKGNRKNTRRNQLADVLLRIGHPAHFEEIARVYHEMFTNETYDNRSVHLFLQQDTDTFIRTRRGVYGLIQWKNNGYGEIANEEINKKPGPISRARKQSGNNSCDRLVDVLIFFNTPTHYKMLAKQHNERFPEKQLTEATVFHILSSDSTRFARVSPGTFSLSEWGVEAKPKAEDRNLANQLVTIFQNNGSPISLGTLTQNYQEQFPDISLSRDSLYHSIYWTLKENTHLFCRIKQGIYGLAEWRGMDIAGNGKEQTTQRSGNNHVIGPDTPTTPQVKKRLERIISVFLEFNQPTNAKLIIKRHNELYPEQALKVNHLYSVFFKHKERFVRVEKSKFALTEWGYQPSKSSSVPSSSSNRRDRLIPILRELNRPASVKEIRELHNANHPDYPLSQQVTYETMFKYPETFQRVGKGVFTLINE